MDFNPKLGSDKFKCPHCQVVSQQRWFDSDSASAVANAISREVYFSYRASIQSFHQDVVNEFLNRAQAETNRRMQEFVPAGASISVCSSCSEYALWAGGDLVFPKFVSVDPPNEDMSEDIRALYDEAATIVAESPRGAAALLRLALQLLLRQLGKSGENINRDIKDLVSDGLSPRIQQALDLLRVVGNNAVHPGEIDLHDSPDVALKLFHVINFIATETITKPKELDLLYEDLVPDRAKEVIRSRDRKNTIG